MEAEKMRRSRDFLLVDLRAQVSRAKRHGDRARALEGAIGVLDGERNREAEAERLAHRRAAAIRRRLASAV